MMETIISKNNGTYRMAVVFDKATDQYQLQFSSLHDNRSQIIPCTSFTDARARFINNVRFYHGSVDVAGVPLTEEEFLGITPGLLGPNPLSHNPKTPVQEAC